jgi:hypothetical protein
MNRWTFRGEAGWMVWLYILPPAVGILATLLIPWLRHG